MPEMQQKPSTFMHIYANSNVQKSVALSHKYVLKSVASQHKYVLKNVDGSAIKKYDIK